MKFFILVSLFLYCTTTFAEALRIVNPILFINKKNPEVASHLSKQIIRYKTKIIFALYNEGKEIRPIATKIVSIMNMVENNGTLSLTLSVNDNTFLVENKEKNLPKIPIVRSDSSFEIVDLRPGEAVLLTYETSILKQNLSNTQNIVFKYEAKDPKGRYSFWTGSVKSESYPFPNTKNFHILTAAPITLTLPNSEADTVLLNASRDGNVEIIKSQIARQANVNAKDENGRTALMLASLNGNPNAVKALLDAHADVNAKGTYGTTALMDAIGHESVVRLLLAATADVNAKNQSGVTAMMIAAYNGKTDTVRMLLEAKADVNAQDLFRCTALMIAGQRNKTDVIKVLLKAGANVDLKDIKEKTALDYCPEIRKIQMKIKQDAIKK